ncbi:MAG: hypothetical protein ACI4L7_00295 [Christensenellales bacterium]
MNFGKLRKIERDLFGIAFRLRRVHRGYKIFWDKGARRFVVFDGREFAFCCEGKLDKSVIDKAQKTNVRFAKKIVADIDKENARLEQKTVNEAINKSKLLLSNRMAFAEKSKRDCDFLDADTTRWI